jgi:hypothetical protein
VQMFFSIVASIMVLMDHNTREPGRVTSDMLPRQEASPHFP